jgi:DNA-binding CsgD family transcriptional regulator
LLDALGRVLSLNTVARCCLGHGLALNDERLSATDQATNHRLQDLIESAIAPIADPNLPISVAVRRRSRLPLVIRAIRPAERAGAMPGSANLLLLALDPELRREPPREILTQAFELTPAEADIAIGIASGKSLAEIATDRGVTIEAVRIHSKRVFSKTHTRGQPELAGLLTRLAFVAPQAQREPHSRKGHAGPLSK